jgi:hypothetical protein
MSGLISRQAAITLPVMPKEHREYQTFNLDDAYEQGWNDLQKCIEALPSAQPEEVIPHRNYKCLSDYWCECGWHLGKKGDVKYCAECGRKVNWDE